MLIVVGNCNAVIAVGSAGGSDIGAFVVGVVDAIVGLITAAIALMGQKNHSVPASLMSLSPPATTTTTTTTTTSITTTTTKTN